MKLFGRNYETIGNPLNDLVLQTRGKVKIRYGNKYIDLIKDGKIVNDGNLIKTVNNEDEIGSASGFYYVEENGSLFLVINGNKINLFGEVGTTYVSFVGEQSTSNTQKEQAQQNIGLLFSTLKDAQLSGIQNGFVYILNENEFYKVTNGEFNIFTTSSNNFNKQVIIELDNSDDGSSLYIKGYLDSKNNQLIIGEDNNSLFIYSQPDGSYFNANLSKIEFRLYQVPIFTITTNRITSNTVIESTGFISDNFTSLVNDSFRLYSENNESTLIVDNIIVRNGVVADTIALPSYWMNKVNTVNEIISPGDTEDPEEPPVTTDLYEITLNQLNEYQVGDVLAAIVPVRGITIEDEEESNDEFVTLVKIIFTVEEISDNTISVSITWVDQILIDSLNITEDDVMSRLIKQTVFLISNITDLNIIKFKDNNIDLITTTTYEDESDLSKVKSRIGNIRDLNLSVISNGQTLDINSLLDVSKTNGIFSDNLVTNNSLGVNSQSISHRFHGGPNNDLYPEYDVDLIIPPDDDSKKIATTEWVNDLFFPGMIVMYNGQAAIPNGWAICNGSSGTPNLIDKFIKAGTTAGATGGASQVTLTDANLPTSTYTTNTTGNHSHSYVNYKTGASSLSRFSTAADGDSSDTSGTTGQSGNHSHTVRLNTGTQTPINIEPNYYSLIFIMKL